MVTNLRIKLATIMLLALTLIAVSIPVMATVYQNGGENAVKDCATASVTLSFFLIIISCSLIFFVSSSIVISFSLSFFVNSSVIFTPFNFTITTLTYDFLYK